MKSEKIRWSSPSMGEKVVVEVYGSSGTPVILFDPNPDTDDNSDREEMLQQLDVQLRNGYNRVYCPQKSAQGLLKKNDVSPDCRLTVHMQFESFVNDELLPRILKESGKDYVMIAGAGWGAFLALNFMLKYPEKYNKLIATAGPMNLRPWFEDYFSQDFYYNNPTEYLPNLTDPMFLDLLRARDLRIITLEKDPCRSELEFISDSLYQKQIDHVFDVWGADKENSLETWGEILQKQIF